MARVRVVFNKGTFAEIAQEMTDRVATATAVTHREIDAKLKVGGPPRSSPGEPPRADTGRLRGSIEKSVFREGNTIRGQVSTNVEYAPFLEYGTAKMAARPFMRPTLAEQADTLKGILRGKAKA